MASSRLFVKTTNFSLIVAALFLLSCSKESTGFIAKGWHNTHSFFNGYYNANQLYKETAKRIDEMYRYPDETLFEITYYGNENEAKGFEGDFDVIIEKNDVVIFKHPNGNWVDDCRLLNGKAWFYKQNYSLAAENFDFILEEYPESKLIPEVYLWKAKALYQADEPELALEMMERNLFPYDTIKWRKRAAVEYAIFEAQLAADNEDYPRAAELIETHVEKIKHRQDRAEAYFLLGQLYAYMDDYPRALENYSLVGKFSQDYDLTFNSKMKVARLYVNYQDLEEGDEDDYNVYKYLTKMLNDDKNFEYQDRIYYEFGMLELKRDSLPNAIDNFSLSLQANSGNARYNALANYQIGLIYFNKLTLYDSAQVYLDAAAAAIVEDEPEYFEITNLAATLKDYVTYKNTIAYQDSMLYLGTLSKEELDKVVANVVAIEEAKRLEELRKEQERLRAEQQAQNSGQGSFANNTFLQNFGENPNQRNQGASSWYFDNPSAVTGGIQQFQQKWGQRKNEDNWRRRNKAAVLGSGEEGEVDPEVAAEEEAAIAEKDSVLLKEFGDNFQFYRDVPRDEEMVLAANEKIEEAMYKLGQLYELRLSEPDSAIKIYEELLDRYDESEYSLRARYALYKLYEARDNPLQFVHRNYIVNEHPKTVYAYLIEGKDPRELRESEDDFSYAYTGLFSAYRDRQYETAIGFSDFLIAQFSDNPQIDMAELQYIRGMSYGYLGLRDSLQHILTTVVTAYPNADVTPIAKKTLEYLRNGVASAPQIRVDESTGESTEAEEGGDGLKNPKHPRYQGFAKKPKPNDKIFVLMYVDKKNISKNDATVFVSNFNSQNFKDKNLKTFTFLYQGSHLLPYVSHFTTIEDAEKYIEAFMASTEAQQLLVGENDTIFYISHSNFKIAYGRKRLADYLVYYENILTGK